MNRFACWGFVAMLVGIVAGCASTPDATSPPPTDQVVYVTSGGDGVVTVYDLDHATGRLTQRQQVAVGKNVGAMAVHPNGEYAYAAVRGERAVATLSIESDGSLTPIGTTPLGIIATFVQVDRTGRWLLACDYGRGKVVVHPIGTDSVVRSDAEQRIDTDRNAHAILTDRSNRFAFVPHTGPSAIYQFRFDENTGKLSPNEPPVLIEPDGAGPRHVRFHPGKNILYGINELNSTITAYHFNPSSGTLRSFQNIDTLPDDFEGRNTCAEIHLSPDGRFLYGSNRGHNSLAAYAVDPETGRLTFIDRFETEAIPRGFDIDETGRYLYAAGQDSDRLAAYAIDPKTGRLTRIGTYDIGARSQWVQVVPVPGGS